MEFVFDEYNMRNLPPRQRLDKVIQVLKKEMKEMNLYDGIVFGLQEK